MPIYIGDYVARLSEQKKALRSTAPLLGSCFDCIDASLWLIAGGRIPQALSLLHNGIELALKAELERIHRVFIVDNRKLDYQTLKSLLKEAFQSHPHGAQMEIPDFDVEYTITFSEAMKRVKDLYKPLINRWQPQLEAQRKLRNDMVHFGSKPEDEARYAEAIATVAFPFLEKFLEESNQISLEKLVTPGVYRELRVARKVYERLNKEGREPAVYPLKTVAVKVLYDNVEWPKAADDEGWGLVMKAEVGLAIEAEKEVQHEWDYWIKTECTICDYFQTFVKVKPSAKPIRSLTPLAVRCPRCNLNIYEKEAFLAEYHVGDLGGEVVKKFFEELNE